MTMADNSNINGTSSSPVHHESSTTAHNVANDPKKRKRKRLSAVLDKLHNTNSVMMNNPSTNTKLTATNNSNNSSSTNDNHLARSVQENAEILRNLFALSQGLPPQFAFGGASSPFTIMIPSPNASPLSYECNNNNSNNHNENFAMMKKIKVKEEPTIGEEEANCSPLRRCVDDQDDTKPLHDDFLQHLPKTTASTSTTTIYNSNHHATTLYGQHQMNGTGYYYDHPQEFPLDLSMKNFINSGGAKNNVKRRKSSTASNHSGGSNSNSSSPSLTKQLLMQQTERKINAVLQPLGIQVPKDCSISIQSTPNSASSSPHQLPQYYQDLKVSPIVEEVAPGSNGCFVCPICGQMFSLNDRLAKHIASRHKTRSPASESPAKCYVCEVCNRSFARSDMLTRHMRLHTGIKPYNCNTCGQVFSRSDHLSTHQRTHTGEKPYRCPQCNYAACRRDMITRHMRTHARYEQNGTQPPPRRAMKVKTDKVKMERDQDESSKLMIDSNINNNDNSMFNQNNLGSMNELRIKLQENFLAHSGLMPSEISDLKREIKIEF